VHSYLLSLPIRKEIISALSIQAAEGGQCFFVS